MSKLPRKIYIKLMRKCIFIECVMVLVLIVSLWNKNVDGSIEQDAGALSLTTEGEAIKWVDFNVSYEALCKAYEWDVATHGSEHELDWVDLLAYVATKTGGTFDKSALDILEKAAAELSQGNCTLEELTKNLKYFPYYREAYGAVLDGLVGEYWEIPADTAGNVGGNAGGSASEGGMESTGYIEKYGLKAYFPLARGFDYSHFDDFGASRSYGYDRKHLGHDMMGQTGTPIIAVESGVVEALGWNQYGGWRVGIRSFDGKRYYYYAHLRQNYPFAEGLQEGSVVTAGDVIGYMGHTGYSPTENVNNIEVTHLHWGLELIFDEERREAGYEIWVDLYPLTRFLAKHTQETMKVEGTKEWVRSSSIVDPEVEAYLADAKKMESQDTGNQEAEHSKDNVTEQSKENSAEDSEESPQSDYPKRKSRLRSKRSLNVFSAPSSVGR